MLIIDGSFGEGGGQIVRSSLALAVVTGPDVTIENLRAGRQKPGLRQQHLTAVNAAAGICGAKVEGAQLGSTRVTFRPGSVTAGEYRISVGTAGSATLVLQTVLPALLLCDGPSKLILEGGTHNPWAPPFDFLSRAYLPLMNRMGPSVGATLERHGFYPAGGGQFVVHVQPTERLQGFDLTERGDVRRQRVTALVANLPAHIARRECETIRRKSGWKKSCFHIEEIRDAKGPGNVVMIELEAEHVTEVFTAFGQRGVPAEKVAASVWKETKAYLDADVPIGPHLADQLLLPLGIAAHHGHTSTFLTMPLTRHSTTHVEILRKFLDLRVDVEFSETGAAVARLGPPYHGRLQ